MDKPQIKRGDKACARIFSTFHSEHVWRRVIVTGFLPDGDIIAIVYLSGLGITTVLFALFEGRHLWDAFWWAVVTGLTIGYGDIYPQTLAGEILTILWAHFMVLGMLPLMVGHVVLNAVKNRNEFTHEEQEEILNFVRTQKRTPKK